jgi:HlyD family type I secretion membrane fusion protein
MTTACPDLDSWHREVPRSGRLPILLGGAILLAWVLGFGLWAIMAPLDGAVIASGSFVATGQNKQVQHLEGGIIREMLVKEGDLVEAGQILLRLDDTAARAKHRRLVLRQIRLNAMAARLQAEINGFDQMQLPPTLMAAASDPEVKAILQRQENELRARRQSQLAQEAVFRKEIASFEESIRGYETQLGSHRSRLALFQEEINDKTGLLERQLIRKTELLALRRAEASISGELGELLGRIGDARERIARADQQIAQLRSAAIQKAIEELRETETELDDIVEQIHAARDVVERTDVRAPVRGIIVKLNYHTKNGVVTPGNVILELLPLEDELIIEGRIKPSDISHVQEGKDALVRLTALNQRLTPMIKGRVIYLSADAISESVTADKDQSDKANRDWFIVRVRLDEDDARKKVHNFHPTPGMPADIYIKTGERTFFEYLLRPLLDSLARAFREE